jgi:hypothetical protein
VNRPVSQPRVRLNSALTGPLRVASSKAGGFFCARAAAAVIERGRTCLSRRKPKVAAGRKFLGILVLLCSILYLCMPVKSRLLRIYVTEMVWTKG